VIALDFNNPEFQANPLALQKNEAWVALKTLRLLLTMDWQQLVLSKGPRSRELIQSPVRAPRARGSSPGG